MDLNRRAAVARIDADLAEAELRRKRLCDEWARAKSALPSEHTRAAADIDVDIAKATALIAELEARREDPTTALAERATTAFASPEYMATREAARLLGISPRTLEGLRARGEGPPHIRIGRRVLYAVATLRSQAK